MYKFCVQKWFSFDVDGDVLFGAFVSILFAVHSDSLYFNIQRVNGIGAAPRNITHMHLE